MINYEEKCRKKSRIAGILIRGAFFTLSRDKEKMDANVRFIDVA